MISNLLWTASSPPAYTEDRPGRPALRNIDSGRYTETRIGKIVSVSEW